MNKSKNNILLKLLILIFKSVILCLAIYIIYTRINSKDRIHEITDLFTVKLFEPQPLAVLLLVFMLMVLNWLIESKKWQLLVYRVDNINIFTAVKAVFSGAAISIFTPYRVGEMIGRVYHIEPDVRVQAALLTAIGNFAQILVTLLFGTIGLFTCIDWVAPMTSMSSYGIITASVGLSILLLFTYYYLPSVIVFVERFISVQRIKKYLSAYSKLNKKDLGIIFLLSFIRYCVYCSQCYLLLQVCGVELPLVKGLALIAVLFLIITVVPSIVFTELILRSSIALILFQAVTDNEIAVISASFGLWFINLVLPAIGGSAILLYSKRKRRKAI